MATILNAKSGAFTSLMAIVCSSWTTINMYTSGRTVTTPLGWDHREYVQQANVMACRCFGARLDSHVSQMVVFSISPFCFLFPTTSTHSSAPRLCLLLFAVEAMGGCWVVEQPSLSMLRFHPRVMDTFSSLRVTKLKSYFSRGVSALSSQVVLLIVPPF